MLAGNQAPQRAVKRYTLLILIIALLPVVSVSILNAQVLLDRFNDEFPKDFLQFTSTTAGNEHFYAGGYSSDNCQFNYFVAAWHKDGTEIWSTLSDDIQLGSPRQMRVIDAHLYVVTIQQAYYDDKNAGHAMLWKFDAESGKLIWRVIVEHDDEIAEILDLRTHPDGRLQILSKHKSDNTFGISLIHQRFQFNQTSRTLWGLNPENTQVAADESLIFSLQGHMYFCNHLYLEKYTAEYSPQAEWRVPLSEFTSSLKQGARVVHANAQHVYVLTARGLVYTLDAGTGDVINELHMSENTVGNVKIGQTEVKWPILYWSCPWIGESRIGISTSKIDLATNSLLWNTQVEFDLDWPANHSMTRQDDGSLIIAAELNSSNTALLYLQNSDGAIIAKNTHSNPDRLFHPKEVLTFGNESRIIGIETSSYGQGGLSDRSISSYWLNQSAELRGSPTKFQSQLQQLATVRNIVHYRGGHLQVRQSGAVLVLVYINQDLGEVWRRILPQQSDDQSLLAIAVNELDQIAVACRPTEFILRQHRDEAPKLYRDTDLSQQILHIISPEGQVLHSHSIEIGFDHYGNPGLFAVGDVFYLSLLARGLSKDHSSYFLTFNAQGLQERIDFTPPNGMEISGELLHQAGQLYYFSWKTIKLYRFDPETQTDEEVMEIQGLNHIDRVIYSDEGGIILLGRVVVDSRTGETNKIMLKLDLKIGQVLWRHQFKHTLSTMYVNISEQNRIYVAQSAANEPGNTSGKDRNLLLTRLNVESGEVELNKLFDFDLDERINPRSITVSGPNIYIAGQYSYGIEEPAQFNHSILLRLNHNGEVLEKQITDPLWSDKVFRTASGELIRASTTMPGEDNCIWEASIYQLPTPTNVKASAKAAASKLHIYPNPAQETCSLVFPGIPGQMYVIVVHDLLGRQVFQTQARFTGAETALALDISSLQNGVYSVEIRSSTTSVTSFKSMIVKR